MHGPVNLIVEPVTGMDSPPLAFLRLVRFLDGIRGLAASWAVRVR
jgi:hypothetical protein